MKWPVERRSSDCNGQQQPALRALQRQGAVVGAVAPSVLQVALQGGQGAGSLPDDNYLHDVLFACRLTCGQYWKVEYMNYIVPMLLGVAVALQEKVVSGVKSPRVSRDPPLWSGS